MAHASLSVVRKGQSDTHPFCLSANKKKIKKKDTDLLSGSFVFSESIPISKLAQDGEKVGLGFKSF